MININGIELEFDITSPADIMRYKTAGEKMEAEGAKIVMADIPTNDPKFLDEYIDMLNKQLHVFAAFIDEIFGEGIAQKLLGANPSLNKITEINEALSKAMQKQGTDFGVRLEKYKPNSASRRGGAKQ